MCSAHAGDLLLWRLVGPPGPPITHSLTVAQAGRAAEMRISLAVRGTEILPDCLHGPLAAGEAHRHAFRIALDRDGDGRIDHLAYHVPGGLCLEAAKLLAMLGSVRVHGFGHYDLVATLPDAELGGPARRWRAVTPFFAPRHSRRGRTQRLRAGYSASEQLVRELDLLGRSLPPCAVAALDPARHGLPSPRAFRRGNEGRRANAPGRPETGYFMLTFETPVMGPIAAGYGAHFGLGCFVPDRPVQTPHPSQRVGKRGNA
jgi:CRISPR-associated protein Csb2